MNYWQRHQVNILPYSCNMLPPKRTGLVITASIITSFIKQRRFTNTNDYFIFFTDINNIGNINIKRKKNAKMFASQFSIYEYFSISCYCFKMQLYVFSFP